MKHFSPLLQRFIYAGLWGQVGDDRWTWWPAVWIRMSIQCEITRLQSCTSSRYCYASFCSVLFSRIYMIQPKVTTSILSACPACLLNPLVWHFPACGCPLHGKLPCTGTAHPLSRTCQNLCTSQPLLHYQINSFQYQLKPFGLPAVCQCWPCHKYVSVLD